MASRGGNTGALILLTQVLVSYVSRAIPIPQKPSMFALLVVFFLANYFGVRIAAGVERVFVVIKLAAFAIFVIAGVSSIDTANFHPLLGTGWSGVFAALPLLVSLYMGIEGATEVGEEIRNGPAVIARGLGIAVLLTIVVYVSVSSVALGVLGGPALGASNAPLLDAGAKFWAVGIRRSSSLQPWRRSARRSTPSTSRSRDSCSRWARWRAAGRIRTHPPALCYADVAVIAVFVLGVAGLMLPSSLVFLFLAVGIPTTLKYISNCWSAWRLVDNYPELRERAKFQLSKNAVKWWAGAGIVCGIFVIVAGWTADWRPYAILGAWFAIGCVY